MARRKKREKKVKATDIFSKEVREEIEDYLYSYGYEQPACFCFCFVIVCIVFFAPILCTQPLQ